MKKKLAVIILNWNGRKLLERFIPDAAANTIGEEADLFVADNGSTDDSLEWLRANHPGVKVIPFPENYGFAEGYNRALEATRYPYTVLLNSDVRVPAGWWQPLLHFMEENPDVAACQPKIRSERQPEMFEYAGAAGGYLDRFGYPYCRGRLFDRVERDEGQYDGPPADVAWASGAALMVRTQDYLDAGGLDADFFAHMEEIDLCCRLLARGRRVCALTDSAVYHVGGASLDQSSPQKTYLNFRNNLLLLHKNLPRRRGRSLLFKRRLLDTLAFGMFLLKGNFSHARAVLKAHGDFRRMRRKYTDLPERDVLSTLPGAGRCIVLDRYLFNKSK
ncbi:MAG: glycosyltransferase family 2 protein [Porphyromonadaceae bacterium]|nr:glycosyltransferase family 2 protein [Porphyromonadaceae bacterium]MDD6315176.1 glycosyltransferase family 2 protein [Porphyromonadaceae bacterium]